ncbi:sensor histidine kinase [Xanthomonas maliensis]|uniref:sensor histidine kinase n=1 Tax=Xanthomonas maliensis TaxID=1321368 RepID=UPI0003AA1DE1|nr:sensor histidine kinase [Xanthomonas maliensis]KAB7771139.1 ATP-binding protein [Xanthomonas maliensis]
MPHASLARSASFLPTRTACWAWLVLGLAWLPIGLAAAATTGIASTREGLLTFHPSAWSTERGAPADIWDMAQARSGPLWLATGFGLFQFDGERFARLPPPAGQAYASHNMTALRLLENGAWIGYFSAGIDRLADGRLTHYAAGKDIPPGMVFRLEYDASGRLWAAIDGGLCWFDGLRWRQAGADWGYLAASAQWLLRDRRGTLWVSDGQQLLSLPAGGTRFVPSGQRVGQFTTLAESPDGRIWVADPTRGLFPLTAADGALMPAAARVQPRFAGLSARRIQFSRDGALWGSDYAPGGVFRIAQPQDASPVLEHVGTAQGLTSAVAGPLLEDREGNFWAGTNLGLNRFRHRALLPLAALLSGHTAAVAVFTSNGPQASAPLLAALRDGRLLALSRRRIERLQRDADPAALALPDDFDGWALGPHDLLRIRHGHAQPVDLPASVDAGQVRALLVDDAAGTLVCPDARGPFRLVGSTWQPIAGLQERACSVLARGSDGRLWVGDVTGELRVQQAQQLRRYGLTDGLAVGPLTALWSGPELTVAAGESGLAVLTADDRFHDVPDQPSPVLQGITGIVRDRRGDLWLNGNRGVVQLSESALRDSVRSGLPAPTLRLYDTLDGLPGIAQQAMPVPSAVAAADGLLWFTGNQGLAWLDPAQTYRNPSAPRVSIRDVVANDRPYAPQAPLQLPQWTDRLRVAYEATSLTRPERVRFRYRLEGVESQWQDAGNRTEAFYANLGPGRYRFHVAAANSDDVWGEEQTLDMVIAPAFVQTWQFQVCCVLAGLAALASVWQLRTRRIAARLRARLEERYRERERIARELHDTLLQGTQGLILRVHSTSRSLPPEDPRRVELERTVELAERALEEGRDRVSGLRDSQTVRSDLGLALQQARTAQGTITAAQLLLQQHGQRRPLRPLVADELFQLGREALANADRHARASTIVLELRYGSRDFMLRIRDDGSGLAPDVLHGRARTGHWGLTGMQERAQRIGARMQLWSRPGSGTEIQVVVPARSAYARRPRRRWWWPFQQASREHCDE